MGTDCHRSIIIKSGSASVLLEIVGGRLKLSDEMNTYVIPYTVQNMEINEVRKPEMARCTLMNWHNGHL